MCMFCLHITHRNTDIECLLSHELRRQFSCASPFINLPYWIWLRLRITKHKQSYDLDSIVLPCCVFSLSKLFKMISFLKPHYTGNLSNMVVNLWNKQWKVVQTLENKVYQTLFYTLKAHCGKMSAHESSPLKFLQENVPKVTVDKFFLHKKVLSDHTRIFFVGPLQPYFPQQLLCVACIIFVLTTFKANALHYNLSVCKCLTLW